MLTSLHPRLSSHLFLLFFSAASLLAAGIWNQPIRGAWLSDDGGFLAVDGDNSCLIAVGEEPSGPVRKAAEHLAADIEKISGRKPDIVARVLDGAPAIVFHDLSQYPSKDPNIGGWLDGQSEAYVIRVSEDRVTLVGADARGAAYAGYALSERIGIDPIYIWTGYTPEERNPLRIKAGEFRSGTPAIRNRGFFHDDEDILPRPLHPKGKFPDPNGTIDDIWFQRYFETAMRLHQNMVAPYTRTQRKMEIYDLANEYGLSVTTHHYDVLMSNVWGFKRHGLAEELGIDPVWDYRANKEGMIKYWRNAVEKLKGRDVVWSIGMRADGDRAYKWPERTTDADRKAFYDEVHGVQMGIVEDVFGPGQEFVFTAWGEVEEFRRKGIIELPENVTLVWADHVPAGYIRALPEPGAPGLHGIYYHLSILTGRLRLIQNASIVSEELISDEFDAVFDTDATDYLLTNISEMREFIREARLLADISVRGNEIFELEEPAAAFRSWFSKEYFGDEIAEDVDEIYESYYGKLLTKAEELYVGNKDCLKSITYVEKALKGESLGNYNPALVIERMEEVVGLYGPVLEEIEVVRAKMDAGASRFFEENCELPLRMVYQPAKAAIILNEALADGSENALRNAIESAKVELSLLIDMLDAAEREPFERWYGFTWPKNSNPEANPRLPFEQLNDL